MGDVPLIVLAGGFGTRMSTILTEVPKSLAPVNQRPFLSYLLDNWTSQGVKSVIFLLHYKAELIKKFVLEYQDQRGLKNCGWKFLTEPTPMGTGGALAYCVRELNISGEFIVANADTWLDSGLAEMRMAIAPTIGVTLINNPTRYGIIKFDENKIVTSFEEKGKSSSPNWINIGLYKLNSEMFESWDGAQFSLENQMFPLLVKMGKLSAVPISAKFIDIGMPDDYFRFCNWIKAGRHDNL